MVEGNQSEIQNQLKNLPKPAMQVEKQNQMFTIIDRFETKHKKRRKWGKAMSKVYVGLATIGALLLFSFITFHQMDEIDSGLSTNGGIVSEYVDLPHLGDHQVVLENLYVEIPFRKTDVEVIKRTTADYVFIDIKEKNSEQVLYTYGESVGDHKEEFIFREIHTDKTILRLQAFVELDSSAGLITKVNETNASYEPLPIKIEHEAVNSGSRSGNFPTEKVEVLASISLGWENYERQEIYEGFVIGAVKE